MSKHSLHNALLKYAGQLPRYTSYPTAPHFKPVSTQLYRSAIAQLLPDEPVSLYIHIPYCKKLCWFCGCNTRISQKYEPVQAYLELLLKEIALLRAAAGNEKLSVSNIHFGGGSPTILECDDFRRCMRSLRENFNVMPDARIAIEIDPRTVNEAKIALYKKSGVNRVSIGVQDFDHEVQVAINRVQPLKKVYEAVQLCRDYGIAQVNFDLIYGLPGQTPDSMRKSIEYTLLLKPDRIAVFGYAHVPWKKKNIRLIQEKTLPDEAMRLQLYTIASEMLVGAGYVAIGIDHFAKPDDPLSLAFRNHTLKRNFQGYTVDSAATLLGLGSSAIGSLKAGYFQNSTSIEDYANAVLAGNLPVLRGFILSDQDRLRRSIIEEIMCYLQVDYKKFCDKLDNKDAISAELHCLAHDGLISMDNGVIRVNSEIPQAARIVGAVFDQYNTADYIRHSQVA